MMTGLRYGAPRWLVEALGHEWNAGQVYPLDREPGFDHVRTYKGRVVISQPYEANEEIANVLAKLVDQGVKVRLWGISPYNPGRTFSIVLWRKEDKTLAREVMEKMFEPFNTVDNVEPPTMKQWTGR